MEKPVFYSKIYGLTLWPFKHILLKEIAGRLHLFVLEKHWRLIEKSKGPSVPLALV